MSGALNNNAGEIIQQLLANLGVATLPISNGIWPVFYNHIPDRAGANPYDETLCVTDTEGIVHGRTHTEGDTQEHYGFQIEARARIQKDSRQRIQHIDRTFATGVLQTAVTLGSNSYLIQAISRTSSVLFVGQDEVSRRKIYTANYIASITMLNAENFGTGT